MSQDAYRARIGMLERRRAELEERRMDAIERAVRLEGESADPRVVSGMRRQAARLEQQIADAARELAELQATLERGVVAWVDGEAAPPELPPLHDVGRTDDRRHLIPGVPRPLTAAGRRLARKRERRPSAALLTVLIAASGRSGRSALAREVAELEDWLDAAGHAAKVEIETVHARRFGDLESAFEQRQPAVVHVVGRPRKPEALLAPLAAAGEGLAAVFLASDRSLEDAEWLAQGIPVAIGSPRNLDREVRTAFAAVLYAALAHGMPVADAFAKAQSALAAAHMTKGEGPRMFARIAANPAELRAA